jgi:RNA polymerase sigma factor (sigma-70 family)
MSTAATFVTGREQELLHLARRGDERAYGELVEPHRSAMHAHCYRMLGSLEDADDALQEALLRAWRALGRFERRSSFRTWLYKISTNTCLQLVARRPKRRLPSGHGPAVAPHTPPGEPLSESVWIEPYPDESLELEDRTTATEARYEQRESVELAFVATRASSRDRRQESSGGSRPRSTAGRAPAGSRDAETRLTKRVSPHRSGGGGIRTHERRFRRQRFSRQPIRPLRHGGTRVPRPSQDRPVPLRHAPGVVAEGADHPNSTTGQQ